MTVFSDILLHYTSSLTFDCNLESYHISERQFLKAGVRMLDLYSTTVRIKVLHVQLS